MMSIEKVYDELYGMIEDLKKQIAAGSGSDVSITPALESGTKVADFEIDGEAGVLYAPTPETPADPLLFLDVAHKTAFTYGGGSSGQLERTAVNDCAMKVSYGAPGASSSVSVKVDDVVVSSMYGVTVGEFSCLFYVKAGQVVTTVGSPAGSHYCDEFPLLGLTPPAPEVEAKKTTKKK